MGGGGRVGYNEWDEERRRGRGINVHGRVGGTVIDYVMGDRGAWEKVDRVEVGKEVESDHQSISVWLGEKRERERKRKGVEWTEKEDWSEEAREDFRKRTEKLELGQGEINEEWEKLTEKIRKEVKVKKIRGWKEGRRGWWDGECRRKKRELEKVMKEWKRGKGSGEMYRKKRGEYREMCERKRREESERWMDKAREAKTQKQVWEVINRERRRKVEVNKEIGMEEWDGCFRGLLGGTTYKVERKNVEGGGGRS